MDNRDELIQCPSAPIRCGIAQDHTLIGHERDPENKLLEDPGPAMASGHGA